MMPRKLKAEAVALLRALGCAEPTEEQVRTLLALAARIVSNKFSWDLRDVIIDPQEKKID